MQDGNVIASSASHNVNVCSTRSSKSLWWTELFWQREKPVFITRAGSATKTILIPEALGAILILRPPHRVGVRGVHKKQTQGIKSTMYVTGGSKDQKNVWTSYIQLSIAPYVTKQHSSTIWGVRSFARF